MNGASICAVQLVSSPNNTGSPQVSDVSDRPLRCNLLKAAHNHTTLTYCLYSVVCNDLLSKDNTSKGITQILEENSGGNVAFTACLYVKVCATCHCNVFMLESRVILDNENESNVKLISSVLY